MKHEFIQEHRSKWRVSRMCRALGTSEAGYYAKLSRKPSAYLVVQALQQAVRRREPPEGLIFHSDRGVQYRSRKHRACLDQNGIQGSMSQKGCPYDNACAESFFATLKKEWIYRHSYASLEEVDSSLFEYIELFYNRKRMHTSLGNLSDRKSVV